MNKNKGITLIALVITIIVLLILAAITINMVIGNNGIIEKAQEAQKKQEAAEKDEQNKLNTLGNKIDQYVKDESNSTGNKDYTDSNGDTAIIPDGFEVIEDAKIIEDGLVIEDEKGNQFVWIPVSEEEYTDMIDDTTGKGKLYKFYSNKNYILMDDCLLEDSTGYREPDVLPYYDESADNLQLAGLSDTTTIEDFKIQLQNEFKAMAKSVKQYKGFYIGRYETSLTDDKQKVETKRAIPMNTLADSGNTWYGLYGKQKQLNTNSKSVKTGMIWGCQWDHVMKYIDGSIDGNGNTFDVLNCSSIRHTANIEESGINDNDKVKNIFDLEGNAFEAVMEAESDNHRVVRGSYTFGRDGASYYNTLSTDAKRDYYGSRLMLYI